MDANRPRDFRASWKNGSFLSESSAMTEPKLLTFELSADRDELEIHTNRKGLEDLIYYLERLLNSSNPLPRHDHLMTEAWGGYELTQDKQDDQSRLINKVDVKLWE